MKNFAEWLKENETITEGKSDNKKLMDLLMNADWTDTDGVVAKFDTWEEGTKENKIYIIHPQVGRFMITVVRNLSLPPKQIYNSVMRDYKYKVEQLKFLQSKRKAV